MAASDHIGFADELIETARALGLRSETDVPVADPVALQISERPTLKADDELREVGVVEIAAELHQRGARRVRLNTDGLASLVYKRDVTPDLEGPVDALSISLNAQNEAVYNRHCRPTLPGSYNAVLEFADRVRDFVPDVTLTAIDGLEGVDIAACERIALDLGVKFRRRVLGAVG